MVREQGTNVLTSLLLAAVIISSPHAAVSFRDFGDCDALVRRHPRDPDAYACFEKVAGHLGDWEGAARRLDALLALDADRHWAAFYLARAYNRLGRNFEETIQHALRGFVAAGDPVGEIRTRRMVAFSMRRQRRFAEAREQLEQARVRAEEAGEVQQGVGVLVDLGWLAMNEEDYRQALQCFREVERAAFPDGPLWNRLDALDGLAAVSFATGRFMDSWNYYRRQETLVQDDVTRMAGIIQNMVLAGQELAGQGRLPYEELRRLERQALELALSVGDRPRELRARIVLSQGLEEGDAAVEESRKAVALARRLDHEDLFWALWVLAENILAVDVHDPGRYREARRQVEEAIRIARGRGDRMRTARSLAVRAALSMKAARRDESIADHEEALDAIELMRDLQHDSEIRTRVFARFSHVYRRFAAMLMATESHPPTEGDLARALTVLERLHARELLDRMDAAGGSAAVDSDDPLFQARDDVLAEIASVQTRLLEPSVIGAGRSLLLARLAELELRESEIREQIARSDPAFASLRMPRLARLEEVRNALGKEEAMIMFVSGRASSLRSARQREEQPSLALILQADTAEVIRLPVPSELRHDIELLLVLMERRDGAERPAATALGEKLLRQVLPRLHDGVRRLIMVPDGDLHHLPFAALGIPGEDRPLAAAYDISLVPSATAWLRWRREQPGERGHRLLSLADPSLPIDPAVRSTKRSAGILSEAPRLGRLPQARWEARSMLRELGGDDGKILIGEEASERALKRAAHSRVRILHLAAHALVDDEHPERSSLVLSPGAPEEDGLLQFREILDLDLDDQLVLLSACRSGGGPIIGGDGILGLASAFFRAGARTVVAGLTPVRDDEASVLVVELGKNLGKGLSVGESLGAARRTLIRRGAPAAAWSSLVVLGDADLVVRPRRFSRQGQLTVLGIMLGVFLLFLLAALRMQRHRIGNR